MSIVSTTSSTVHGGGGASWRGWGMVRVCRVCAQWHARRGRDQSLTGTAMVSRCRCFRAESTILVWSRWTVQGHRVVTAASS